MIPISTKTGDKGETGLANGQRFGKDSVIFEVLGTQDELNSWLGLVLVKLNQLPNRERFVDEKKFILEIQDNLFQIGAELARSPKIRLTKEKLAVLEKKSNDLQNKMEKNWVTKFLYPGGVEAAAVLDLARTVSRRFERVVVRYAQGESQGTVSPLILQYVNRLSDFLFVLRCFVNHEEQYAENVFEGEYKKPLKKNLKAKGT